jgi:hypothetical protein
MLLGHIIIPEVSFTSPQEKQETPLHTIIRIQLFYGTILYPHLPAAIIGVV